ncbi:MAG: enoyl-CoA hydratase/isomerase family protein [Gammaproteobacteria bacterium]
MALVDYVNDSGVGWVRLNRPDKRNAMNQAARDELRAALEQAREEVSVVVLTGCDGAYCAGMDLKEIREQSEQGSEAGLADWRALNVQIREHPAIFIAAVNGLALGGGLTLVSVCDLAIAAEDAEFGMPEVGFGMYPNPSGPATQLSLTRKRAAWLVLTTERIDGRTAASWGLINEAVPAAALEARAREIAERLAGFDRVTLREAKRALDTIPLAVDDWASAIAAGVRANQRIRNESSALDGALDRFRAGGRNPGQG